MQMQRTARDSQAPSFRSLLLMLRGRAGMTQRVLAASIGVSERAVQVWEAGLGHPCALSLQTLIGLYVRVGALRPEADEAAALWSAALEEGPRFKTAFDADWFATLHRMPASNG